MKTPVARGRVTATPSMKIISEIIPRKVCLFISVLGQPNGGCIKNLSFFAVGMRAPRFLRGERESSHRVASLFSGGAFSQKFPYMKGSESVFVIIQTDSAKIAAMMKSPTMVPLSFFLTMSGREVHSSSPGIR